MADTGEQDIEAVAQALCGFAQFVAQLAKVMAQDILEFDPFQVAPDPFIRVEFWGVARQLLQMDSLTEPGKFFV